jgi:hypothetical protein
MKNTVAARLLHAYDSSFLTPIGRMISSVLGNIPSESKYSNYFEVLRQKLISLEFENLKIFLNLLIHIFLKCLSFLGQIPIFRFLCWNYNIYSITVA